LLEGGGLYLEISRTGGKLWRFKYYFDGKEKRLAVGKYPELSLANARKCREAARESPDTAHRAHQNCGRVMRYAVATGRAARDPRRDLIEGTFIVQCALRLAPGSMFPGMSATSF
jgi:hypothetical protein